MTNLAEASTFDAGVFELQTTDLVLGGPGGPSNTAAQNLTNRTRWLFDQNTANIANITAALVHLALLDAEVSTINTNLAGIGVHLTSIDGQLPLFAPINSPTFTGVPRAPTAAPGTSTTQQASTAFVSAAINPGSVVSSNGYRKNPDGTIDQWGSFVKLAQNQNTVITFPTSYLTACFNVQLTSTNTAPSSLLPAYLQVVRSGSVSASQFACDGVNFAGGATGGSITVYWRSMGA